VSSPIGDPAEAFLTLIITIPSGTPSTTYHAQYEDQEYRSSERNQDRHRVDPRHRVTDIEEVESNPASQQTAKHTDDDVTNQPISAPPHDLSRQKSGDQANDNPGKYSHNNPPLPFISDKLPHFMPALGTAKCAGFQTAILPRDEPQPGRSGSSRTNTHYRVSQAFSHPVGRLAFTDKRIRSGQ
jgi:hypothetical protein